MNHLAHLFLSPPSMEARVGNLLGDFARGLKPETLPQEVQTGLKFHRAVDSFTDQHPEVLAAKTVFSAQRRRFAGVALDVLFDHYLLRHWEKFERKPSSVFIREAYEDLDRGQYLMPTQMIRVTQQMIRHDWLNSYRNLDNIGFALDRIAQRIRFPNQFAGIITEIKANDRKLETHFLNFFPELIEFYQNL
ncbi:MAG: DUF479 domain-containing protein [Oleiphilaceae bacterium]|nr:DUF479 domain-containing protein [Oleiphilaceae bacterium]